MKRWTAVLASAVVSAGLAAHADDAERRPAERNPGELFTQLDKNSDGQIGRDEVPDGQQRMFERLLRVGDKNADGRLSRDEFVAAMNSPELRAEQPGPGGPGGRPNPGEMFSRMDRNGDGKLTRDEIPEPARERLGPIFDRLGKDALTREDVERAMAQFGGRPGEGRPGEGRPGPEMLERLRGWDANKDGKVFPDEVPEEARPRFREMLQRMGQEFVDLERMARMIEQGGRPPMPRDGDRPRPEGDRPRPEGERPPMGREGDRPRPEGDRPPMAREGDRPRPEGAPRDGDRPRPDGAPRDGDRPRPEGAPRDGEGPPRGEGGRPPFMPRIMRELDRDNDRRLSRDELAGLMERFKEFDRNGDGYLDPQELLGPPPEGMGPGGFGPGREGGVGRPSFGPRDGEGPPRDGFRPPRDGEGPPRGAPPREGDRPAREGERPTDGRRPEPDRPQGDDRI